ncbi:hypothetical protein [Bradyrhizobium sp. BR 1433]|uniref:hypothetical protein n=1 Tax=Bradyrhizobium sp. BR 1433 TaxID=3447967 RepID=UPI003EE5ACB9
MFSREKIQKTAQEIADHLRLTDHIKGLQQAQKEMADAIASLGDRIKNLETELRVIKAETKLEAVRETQQVLNSVQGAFHDKLTEIAVRISHIESSTGSKAALIDRAKRGRTDGELPSA